MSKNRVWKIARGKVWRLLGVVAAMALILTPYSACQRAKQVTRVTYVVAASNALPQSKAQADYVLSGAANELPEIQTIINGLPVTIDSIEISEGTIHANGVTGLNISKAGLKFYGSPSTNFVITKANSSILTGNANSGQPNVAVVNGSLFTIGMNLIIRDTDHFEPHAIQNVVGNTVTLDANLIFSYTVARSGYLSKLFDLITITANDVEVSGFSVIGDLPFLSAVDHNAVLFGRTIYGTNIDRANVHDLHLSNLDAGICFEICDDISVKDCWLTTISDGGISGGTLVRPIITGNHFKEWGCAALYYATCEHGVIANNVLEDGNNSKGKGIGIDGCQNMTVSNNTIRNVRNFGIYLVKENSMVACQYNIVSGNTIADVAPADAIGTTCGILIFVADTQYNTITGNTITGCRHAVKIQDASDNEIIGNIITGNTGHGILMLGTTNRNLISSNTIMKNAYCGIFAHGVHLANIIQGNNIYDCGGDVGSESSGIQFDDTNSSNNIIKGNTILGAGLQLRGIYLKTANCNGNIIEDNILTNAGTIANIVNNGVNTIIRRNQGYTTANSGTATIAALGSSIVVNHGLAATPVGVQVTLTADPGVALNTWVDSLTPTQFTVHVNPAVVNATTFHWRAVTGEGN